ncbi:hypothetical protein G9A89_005247 [Geosiphon pyriformis]|nr:hypothetical protein G9A89_005247 [Geosiphon pyriformis]
MEAVRTVVSEFGLIKLIKMQLVDLWQKAIIELENQNQADFLAFKWSILIGKDAVCVARANTNTHDLWDFVGLVGGKTCVINYNPVNYACAYCATVCFGSESDLVSAMAATPVIKGIGLCWSHFSLALCSVCSLSGHTSLNCASVKVRLATIYARKFAPISCLLVFSDKTWTSVVGAPLVCNSHGTGLLIGSNNVGKPFPSAVDDLEKCLVCIESSLVSLTGQIGEDIVMRIGSSNATSNKTAAVLGSTASPEVVKLENMLEGLSALVMSLSARLDGLALKIAMCNVCGLNNSVKQDDVIRWHKNMNNLVSIFMELKLKGKVRSWLADKFDGIWVFISGLDSGSMSAGVLIVMNFSLARHVCKVFEVPGQLLSIKLLFKDKLSISILGIYVDASSVADKINSLIAKAINESSFIILGGDFNEDGSHKYASFKKCFDLGLINSLGGSSFVKSPTWYNSCGITKTIEYVFISSNLVGAVVDCGVDGIEDYFNTDHKTVYVSVELGGLLDKYNIRNASEVKWSEFRNATAVNAFSDLNMMWDIVYKIMVLSAGGMFKKKWFKSFDYVFNKVFFWFHKLKLLVSKLVKASWLVSGRNFASLLDTWNRLDSVSTLPMKSLFLSGADFDAICSGLAKARKFYRSSKLLESKHAKESSVRQTIERRMESFEVDKSHTIRSVLEHPFHKVVLDHLVDGGKLVLEPELVKSKTRKHVVASDISGDWAKQFWPLDHVFNGAFSDVMHSIGFDEMFSVISNLPDEKAAGLFVLDMLLVFLNFCLDCESVPGPWRKAWVSMILKPYEWEEISLACSTFDVLCGDNFSVLKGTSTQSPIFAIGLVIKDNGWLEFQAGLMSFLAAGAFVDDTIWVGSSQTATQHILNVTAPYLTISGLLISIAKRDEPHYYLGIFLSSEDFSKPSLVKAHSNVRFFTNLILKKFVLDKQFAYLVSSVLFSIVSYRIQFSYISLSVCNKCDTLICKGLKSKSGLPLNFFNNVLHHPSLYNLKTFEQIQAESKSASVIAFVNSVGVLGCLFSHRVSPSDNFLADVVHIFSGFDLSLSGSLAGAFHLRSGTPMSLVLGKIIFFKCISSLRHYGVAFKTFKYWKRLDPHGLVPSWFDLSVHFLGGVASSLGRSSHEGVCSSSDIHQSLGFGVICNDMLNVGATHLFVYTDRSLNNLGTVDILAGAAVFFENIDSGLGVEVSGLVSSTLAELQAIALALECVFSFWSVDLFSDSQAAIDACRLESLSHHHIANVIHCKNLDVNWIKVKGHLGVSGNKRADVLAKNAALSAWHLPYLVSKRFLKAGVDTVFGNSRHFVCDIFRSIHRAHWEIGSGFQFVPGCLHADVDWLRSSLVWHLDSHMATGFTSSRMAGFHTYFMKALHYHFPVASYSSVICLFCGEVEVSDHVFSCFSDANSHTSLLDTYAAAWEMHSGLSRFVFNDWYYESVSVYKDPKVAVVNVVNFVRKFCLAFCDNIWLVCAKHQAIIEKNKLIPRDGFISVTVSGFSAWLLAGLIRLLGVADAFGISFGYCKHCLFYAGVDNMASVHISA